VKYCEFILNYCKLYVIRLLVAAPMYSMYRVTDTVGVTAARSMSVSFRDSVPRFVTSVEGSGQCAFKLYVDILLSFKQVQ